MLTRQLVFVLQSLQSSLMCFFNTMNKHFMGVAHVKSLAESFKPCPRRIELFGNANFVPGGFPEPSQPLQHSTVWRNHILVGSFICSPMEGSRFAGLAGTPMLYHGKSVTHFILFFCMSVPTLFHLVPFMFIFLFSLLSHLILKAKPSALYYSFVLSTEHNPKPVSRC